MYKIYYDNEQFVVLIDGVQHSNGEFELQEGKNYIISLMPIYDKTLFLPITSSAKIKDNDLICSIPHIKIDTKKFYLVPKFAPYLPPKSPKVDMQREFGEHTITVYTDNIPKLIIENKSNFINVLLPEYPDKLQEAVLDNGVLFYCLCPHYLCVVLYDYNDYSVLIDKECDSYEFTENGVKITINLNDNQGRIYTSELSFNGKEYICDNDFFEYSNPHTPHEKLIGYDFLQAVLAEDYDYAQKMLSPNCTQTSSDITKMFENLEDIILPKCPVSNDCVFAIFTNKIVKCNILLQNKLVERINIF